MSNPLPRGVWFEPSRNRYRIRKYRNNKAYLVYTDTLDAALEEYKSMCDRVSAIRRLKRGEKQSGPVPTSSFSGLANAVIETA